MQQSEDSRTQEEKLSFMVVDDEPSVALLIRRLLERAGYTVFSENDSIKALDFIRENYAKIDVLICDMTMPKLTGDILISKVLKFSPKMVAILISGNTFKLPDVLQNFPSVVLLDKPIEEHNLSEAIRHVLENND